MIYSYDVADGEFATLCQSQIKILTESLGASWSAIYIAESLSEMNEQQLSLFSVYPPRDSTLPQIITEMELAEILLQVDLKPKILPSYVQEETEIEDKPVEISSDQKSPIAKQLVLPLLHEEVMMGLLIAGREDRDWQSGELEQVKAIAKTLAIACFLDKQSQWYRQQLTIQQNIRRWEQEQLGDLLHQLRNPLTALRTFSKLLLKRLLPEDRNSSVVGNILRESDRLSGLIDRFAGEVTTEQGTTEQSPLTLSTTSIRVDKNPSNQRNFLLPGNATTLETVDVRSILEPLLQVFSAIAQEKKIDLIRETRDDIPLVKGNFHALREVLNNLLDNAIKYTPHNGKVTVSLKRQDKLLGIVISDTGYGIPEADLEKLFTRNFRGIQAQGDIPGTGLGLAIAKKLVEQMQGDLEVISPNPSVEKNNFPGTTFTLWLSIVSSDI